MWHLLEVAIKVANKTLLNKDDDIVKDYWQQSDINDIKKATLTYFFADSLIPSFKWT